MADVRAVDVVNEFNSRIRNRLNGTNITWDRNNFPNTTVQFERFGRRYTIGTAAPREAYEAFFTGTGGNIYSSPSSGEFSGNADISHVRSRVLAYARNYTSVRRVHVRMRFDYRGMLYEFENATAYGDTNLSSSVPDPSNGNMVAGQDTDLSDFRTYFDQVWNNLAGIRDSTYNFHRDLCHSNCHSSCHRSCHGDGPGDGSSDRRLKSDIARITLALDDTEELISCIPAIWQWNDEAYRVAGLQGSSVGVIADEVEAVRPDLVYRDSDGYLKVRYAAMTAELLAYIQQTNK